MWVCNWLCPKRKKKQQAYDVHQDTFQMDQHIGNIQQPQKNQDEIQKKIQNIDQQSNQRLTGVTIQKKQEEKQKKFIQIKNKVGDQEKGLNEIGSEQKNINEQKKFVQNKNNIQEVPKEQQKKPIVQHPNILKPKKTIKKKYNPDDYRFLNQQGTQRVKKIDSIKQQQFNIDGCKGCNFFIFDITANLYIDDTQSCFIFVAPCQSTIFVRNCKNMTIVAATGQFRTYQCHNCHFSLYCKSQPVIQSSNNLHFSSFQCPQYQQLSKQFLKLKRSPFNNHWSEIHNFTNKNGQIDHYLSRYPEYTNQISWQNAFKQAQIQITSKEQKVVPFIQGKLQLTLQQAQAQLYLVVFDKQMSEKTQQIIAWVQSMQMTILKAEKRKFDGHGKNQLVAMKLIANKLVEIDFQKVMNPTVFSGKQEVQAKQSNYFIDFGDQR